MLRLRTFVDGGLPANFWKLWSSSVAANLADGIISVALPIVAVRLTASPAEIAGVAVAAQIPSLLFGLLAGGLADRLDRRWTMVAVQALRIAVLSVLVILALADGLTIVVLYVAAFVIGTGEAFFDTNAQSIVPEVVGRERAELAGRPATRAARPAPVRHHTRVNGRRRPPPNRCPGRASRRSSRRTCP